MKMVILNGKMVNPGDVSWEPIAKLGELRIFEETPRDMLIENIGDAEIVLNNISVLNKRIIDACPSIKYIGSMATGYNLIDIDTARERGITVTNIPEYGTPAVSQHTIALLLELTNQTGKYDSMTHRGEWGASGRACYWDSSLTELYGKTLGIIGFGSIGRAVGAVAAAMGMKVLAYARTPRPELETESIKYAGLDEIYRQSDFISLHCPLFEENKGMICAEAINKMKDGVYIINTARGGLINEPDLIAALESGKIAGAALDVIAKEPPPPDYPMLHAPNCIITPHIAWAPTETRERLIQIAVENIKAYLKGEPINVVS